jgi:hypothetical protein
MNGKITTKQTSIICTWFATNGNTDTANTSVTPKKLAMIPSGVRIALESHEGCRLFSLTSIQCIHRIFNLVIEQKNFNPWRSPSEGQAATRLQRATAY